LNTLPDYRNQSVARHALRSLYLGLLHEAKLHLDTFRTNSDPLTLKAYRTTVAKLTALVGEFGECMDRDILGLLKTELAALLEPTHDLWDNERILLHLDEYRSMVRPDEHETLRQTARNLETSRLEGISTVRRFIQSSEYRNILSVINDLCDEEKFYNRCSLGSVEEVVEAKIARRLEVIRTRAVHLSPGSSQTSWEEFGADVHRLRYTLKAFAHCLNPEAYDTVRSHLGKLAKSLRQLESLAHQIERIEATFPTERKSVSIILTILGLEEQDLRKKALKHAARLSKETFALAFYALLTPPSA